jgi:hypothetical protein
MLLILELNARAALVLNLPDGDAFPCWFPDLDRFQILE